MLESVTSIVEGAGSTPVIADGDNGYGNAMNVKRTIKGYARAGVACIMLEDQSMPKRCGHTDGKQVIPFEESVAQIRAAVDAREEAGADILIMARTDARGCHPDGMDEAVRRCQAFMAAGADLTFLEAPHTKEEMQRYCDEVPGPKMANMLASGKTPRVTHEELREMGFHIAAYPFDLIVGAITGMKTALLQVKGKNPPVPPKEGTELLWELSGFNAYRVEEKKYQA